MLKDPSQLARMIDHTLLKPSATEDEILTLCREALEYNFWSVCINPFWIPTARPVLQGSAVKICTVIGFPLGATTPRVKAAEANEAVSNGAAEVDMVLNIGALRSKHYNAVLEDIKAVVSAVQGRAVVKVILETGLLNETEKIKACELSVAAGADFVKTSTGFGASGATLEDIALMRRIVGPSKGVKASGGIRDTATALAMIDAGANRIGTSSGIKIISGTHNSSEGLY